MKTLTLYKHQENAITHSIACWNSLPTKKHPLIAHEMGLGKTLTALASIDAHYKTLLAPAVIPRIFIVAPASLNLQWQRAIASFAFSSPTKIKVLSYDSNSDALELASYIRAMSSATPSGAVAPTTYTGVIAPVYIVFDESHYIKNSKTQRFSRYIVPLTRALAPNESTSFPPPLYCMFLSGTPFKNSAGDLFLYHHFNNLYPHTKGQFSFSKKFANDTSTKFGVSFSGVKASNQEELRALNRTFTHHVRTVDAVSLPERVQINHFPPSEADTRKLETADFKHLVDSVVDSEASIALPIFATTDFDDFQPTHDGQLLKAPKQISDYRKVDIFYPTILDIVQNNKKIVIFCDFKAPLELLHMKLRNSIVGKESLLFFPKTKIYYVTGEMSLLDKQTAIDAFNSSDNPHALLLGTIGSIGTGLNLQESCNRTVFLGYPWGYAELDQAEARTRRIGQSQPCFYHYLLSGAYDEKIIDKINNKRASARKSGV